MGGFPTLRGRRAGGAVAPPQGRRDDGVGAQRLQLLAAGAGWVQCPDRHRRCLRVFRFQLWAAGRRHRRLRTAAAGRHGMKPDLISGPWTAAEAPHLPPRDWELLLQQASATRLSARLALHFKVQGWEPAVPERVWQHLQSATRYDEVLR